MREASCEMVFDEPAALESQFLGEPDLAETAFLEALALAPRDTGLNVDYARLLADMNRDVELLAHLKSVRQRLAAAEYAWVIDESASYWLDAGEYGWFSHTAILFPPAVSAHVCPWRRPAPHHFL